MKDLVERFLSYVSIDTQSNPSAPQCPSTEKQFNLANQLVSELNELELSDVSIDENGYVMGRLPSNVDYDVPAIGFIAHMDTAPDASGENVKPQIINNYQGDTITLGTSGEELTPSQFPDLLNLIGHDLITTDGTTLLGADNKAGIAEILTAIAVLKATDRKSVV